MKPSLIEPLESRYAPAALVGITANSNSIVESDGTITFTVTLSETSTEDVTVHYHTENLQATAGEDYVAIDDQEIVFHAGETTKTFQVTIKQDSKYEADETFQVVLSNPTAGVDLDPEHTSAVATILNDDSPPTLSISDSAASEGAQNMTFTLTLSEVSGIAVTVYVSTEDGSATANQDYSPLDHVAVTFAPGQKTATVNVPMLDDQDTESSESFILKVSSTDPNVTVPSGLQATGTILDNEQVNLSVDHVTVNEDAGTASFKIKLSGPSATDVTVQYATVNGTATAGSDYTAVNGTATIPAGQTEFTVTVAITNDNLYEGVENFFLQLSNPSSNVGSITQSQATGTINDNETLPTLTIKGPGNQGADFSVVEYVNDSHMAVVTLTLSGPSGTATVFNIKTLSETGAGVALAGIDYTALDQNITFAPGETTKTFQIPITNDTLDEVDELLHYQVTLVSGTATVPNGGNGSVKILNDDRLITVSDKTVTEANGDTVMTFTVTLSSASTHVVSFDYATANLTAIDGLDYVATDGTIIFNPGETTKTISVTIKGDTLGELDKDFAVNFSNVANAAINKTSVTGHILDDDPYLAISDGRAIEGPNGSTAAMQFTVTLLRATGTVTVNYATNDISVTDGTAATAGTDYIAKSGTLTFSPGQTTKTITISIKGDGDNENDERFEIALSNPTGISTIAKSVGTGTIIDDEGLLVVSNGTIVEGDSGQTNMIFVVNLKNRVDTGSEVKFFYETIDGSAVSTGANPDFVFTSGSITLNTSTNQATISVPIIGDTIYEGTQTFTLRIFGVVNPANETGQPPASIGNEFATGTITDNDAKPTVSIGAGSVVEGNTQGVPYTITLDHASDTPITVDFKTQGGTATAGTDYTAIDTTTITFAPGETTKTVYVSLIDDTNSEADETVIGVISNAQGATLGIKTATGKILNDDSVISIDGFTITEGANAVGKMTLTFSAKPVAAVVLNFSVNGVTATAGADFTLVGSTTRTINPDSLVAGPNGTFTTTIDFNIVDDALNENPETFTVSLNSATNAVIDPAKTTATGTINDNDTAPVISISDASIVEGSGTKTMTFTITLDHASGTVVSVNASTLDDTAVSVGPRTDFTASTNQVITFQPGETTKTFSVAITGDGYDEALTERFFVELSNPTGGATLSTDHKVGTGTIIDDDQRTIQVSTTPVVEGTVGDTKTLEYVVTLSSAAEQQVTVNYVIVNGTALLGTDYTISSNGGATTGTLTFAPGETTQKVILTIIGDDLNEGDETVLLRLSNPSENAKLGTTEVVGKILTDETWFTIEQVVVPGQDPGTVAEGGAAKFTITRHGNTNLSSSVTYTTVDGLNPVNPDNTTTRTGATASSGDYNGVAGTLVFDPYTGTGPDTKTITVQTRDDSIYENNETFSLNLTSAVNGILVEAGDSTHTHQPGGVKSTVSITNNDVLPTISITTGVKVTEGNSSSTVNAIFTVSLSAPIGADDVIITFTTIDGTAISAVHGPNGEFNADYAPQTNGTLRIVAGSLSQTLAIVVNGDDVDEFNETFQVQLTSAKLEISSTPVSFAAGKDIGTATIVDDDVAPTITIADVSTIEGSGTDTTASAILTLSAKSEKPITVKVGTRNGTAELGIDYLIPDDFQETVTFAPGTTTQTVNFTIVGDTIFEANETFAVVLSSPTNAVLKDSGGVITITNDDTAPQLSINSLTITEGDSGFTNMVFTVSLIGSSYLPVTVDYTTKDGTAKANSAFPDYVPIAGRLTFAPGETTKTITVQIYGDIYAEDNESFTVELNSSTVTNATILNGTGSGTIENGSDSIIGIAIRDASVREGDSSSTGTKSADFIVELSKAFGAEVNFSALTRNGTAIAGSDFVGMFEDGDTSSGTPSSGNNDFTIAANELTKTISINITPDTVFEATESFYLSISNVTSGITIARPEARGTIFNDDIQFLNNNKTAQYIDLDGDLVTVTITKGVLNATIDATSINSGAVLIFGPANALGGRALIGLDFTLSPSLFNGTSLTITADAQAGFDTSGEAPGDGRVNVGYIRGAQVQSTVLQFVNGIDFNNITVDGDIGKITAGDLFVTPSIRGKLTAYSIGAQAAATSAFATNPNDSTDTTFAATAGHTLPVDEPAFVGSGSSKTSNLISAFLSTVNSINVETNVYGTLQVIGGVYGNINSLRIGGALSGYDTINSGVVFYTGTLKTATLGSIVGGTARDSGLINGRTDMVGNIGSLHILGDIVGGKDDNSGRVVAKQIGSIVVDGSILGGGSGFSGTDGVGTDSGEVFASSGIKSIYVGGSLVAGLVNNTGQIFTNGTIGSLFIGGSVLGSNYNSTNDSGKVTAGGGLTSATIMGDILGGAGARSGAIQIAGSIGKIVVGSADAHGGNLIGGTGVDSGTISAGGRVGSSGLEVSGGTLTNALLYGTIQGGPASGSGGILAGTQITKLDLRGSLIGGDSLGGSLDTTSAVTQTGYVLAGRIAQMTVGGDVRTGTDSGNGLYDSGVIRTIQDIASLTIHGDVVGNATTRAVISAGLNGSKGAATPAIGNLTIGGTTSYLDIAAGYRQANFTSGLGTAYNADASIGNVVFQGDVKATNVIAGTTAGSDGRFGTDDDLKIDQTYTGNNPKITSTIASVTFNGQILDNDDIYGISAQYVASVIARQSSNPVLLKGAANDTEVDADPENAASKLLITEVAI